MNFPLPCFSFGYSAYTNELYTDYNGYILPPGYNTFFGGGGGGVRGKRLKKQVFSKGALLHNYEHGTVKLHILACGENINKEGRVANFYKHSFF